MATRFTSDEAQEFAAKVVEFSERIRAKRQKCQQLRDDYKDAKKELEGEIEAEQAYIRDFQPGKFPLLDQAKGHNGNGSAESVPPAKPEKRGRKSPRGTKDEASAESVPAEQLPDGGTPAKVGSSFAGRKGPFSFHVISVEPDGQRQLRCVLETDQDDGVIAKRIAVERYPELTDLNIIVASGRPRWCSRCGNLLTPYDKHCRSCLNPEFQIGEPPEIQPPAKAPTGRLKKFDVWHSFGVPSPALLATIEAPSITSAWEKVHSQLWRSTLGKPIPHNQLDVRHSTAEDRRRQEKVAVGRNELADALEQAGARAQARTEANAPDPLPQRPRGRKARKTQEAVSP